jgi:predicted PurR-regulated permease PerM
VLGGAAAFGFIGVFLGPVLLAVGYALLMEWAALRTGADIATLDASDEARGESTRPRE